MNEHQHILSPFEKDMGSLRKNLTKLVSKTRKSLVNSRLALEELDVKKAKKCIHGDNEIDNLHQDINELGIEILTRYSPVASDLRMVVTAIRVSSNFERIADQSVNIAKRVKKIAKRMDNIDRNLVSKYFDPVMRAFDLTCDAFSKEDEELARNVIEGDKLIDKNYKKALKDITKNLEKDINTVKVNIEMSFISRSLERIGDHACNIAEEAIYLKTGETVS